MHGSAERVEAVEIADGRLFTGNNLGQWLEEHPPVSRPDSETSKDFTSEQLVELTEAGVNLKPKTPIQEIKRPPVLERLYPFRRVWFFNRHHNNTAA